MRGYPPSTIHRYLDLPSTQIIQTHISHRYNTTPPLQSLVQAPYPFPTNTTYTTTTQTQAHVHTTPGLTGFLKPKPNPLIHLAPFHPLRLASNTYTSPTHFFPCTTLIHSMSAALDTISEPCVPPTCPVLTTTP